MRMLALMAMTSLAFGATLAPALALDQLITGKKLLVKDTGRKSIFNFQSLDGAILAPSGPDAPTVVGARLQVVNPLTGENRTFEMPAARWRSDRTGTKFTYRDRKQQTGPIVQAIIKNGRFLKVKMKATGITLDEPAQTALSVVFVSGRNRYCTLFPADSIRRDEPCRFLARLSARATQCPDEAISSVTGAFLPQ